ncbi:unnamed protein product [Larinioides sclopetarius]|uniref:Uncharacterized protein n=1 Tax=Larinioides sclopetarius TaxID=280406 RepID=A0AAV2BV64_9ARAC
MTSSVHFSSSLGSQIALLPHLLEKIRTFCRSECMVTLNIHNFSVLVSNAVSKKRNRLTQGRSMMFAYLRASTTAAIATTGMS